MSTLTTDEDLDPDLEYAPTECPACGSDDLHSASLNGEGAVSCCDCVWIATYASLKANYEPPDHEVTDLCEDCNERLITGLDARCDSCRENANERAYDRSMEEPTYRGSEYASALAEQQAQAKRFK